MIRAGRQLHQACFTGMGVSDVGRALYREPADLAIEACMRAISDAGLERSDIDGLAAFSSGAGSVAALEVQDALGLELNWFTTNGIGPSQLSAMFDAVMAVETGRVRHALAFHASCEGSTHKRLGRGGALPGSAEVTPARASGFREHWLPFGAPSAANLVAMYTRRHFAEYGTTREQMAQIALVQRRNAALNDRAIFRNELTMEDYLSARMISDPLCLYDCDIPIDFCSAVVISQQGATRGLARPPILVDALGMAIRSRSSWSQFDDLTTMMMRDAGSSLWAQTNLRQADVDVAMLYDGFSFIAMAWLEALGFCGKGESGPFIEGGKRIALEGELPINTDGGQLSAGRMHGWGSVPEACTQLWGDGGARQVPGNPSVAVVGAGGGIYAGALLLVRS